MRDLMQSVDNNLLIQVPNKSSRSLDMEILTTTKFGLLTPTYFIETVPGGEYTISPETLVRFAPLSSPLMHKCTQKTMFFHVPFRILWDNWEFFIQGKVDPLTGVNPVHPYFTADYLIAGGIGSNGLGHRIPDYFGMKTPPLDDTGLANVKLNPMFLVAYQSIYNRYFRHSTIENEVRSKVNDGLISFGNYADFITPRQITYEDDYFNSMLPTPQNQLPAIIDDYAPLRISSNGPDGNRYYYDSREANGNSLGAANQGWAQVKNPVNDPDGIVENNSKQLFADVSITVEELRRAAALQKFLEISNHTGNYIDYLKAFYNVNFPDSRLQNPEYIGGTSNPIVISDVMNTADANQGRVIGYGAGYSKGNKFNWTCLEHGLIIGLSVITYNATHKHAKPKLWAKLDKYDFFNPVFDTLGEQTVKGLEINRLTSVNYNTTIGYVPKHFEYRSSFNTVTGEMATSYQHYHLARDYNNIGAVTIDFYRVLDERRIFQVQQAAFDPILLQCYNDVWAKLPMSSLPTPAIQ